MNKYRQNYYWRLFISELPLKDMLFFSKRLILGFALALGCIKYTSFKNYSLFIKIVSIIFYSIFLEEPLYSVGSFFYKFRLRLLGAKNLNEIIMKRVFTNNTLLWTVPALGLELFKFFFVSNNRFINKYILIIELLLFSLTSLLNYRDAFNKFIEEAGYIKKIFGFFLLMIIPILFSLVFFYSRIITF